MFRTKLIEPTGFIIAAATFLLSLFLFYNDTDSFLGSFMAAWMAAGLIWLSYLIIRFVLITFRS